MAATRPPERRSQRLRAGSGAEAPAGVEVGQVRST